MLIEAACGDCGAKYKLAEKYSGRRVTCKKCGSMFRVPGEKIAPPTGAVKRTTTKTQPSRSAAKVPARPRKQETPDEEMDLSALLDEEASAEADEFETALPPRSMRGRSRSGKSESGSGKKQRSAGGGFRMPELKFNRTTISACIAVFALLTPLINDMLGTVVIMIVGVTWFLVMIVTSFWLIGIAFQESVLVGILFLLFGPYQLWFIITRWQETKRPMLIWLGTCAYLALLFGMFVIGVGTGRLKPDGPQRPGRPRQFGDCIRQEFRWQISSGPASSRRWDA